MDQLSKVLLAIYKAHAVPQRALDCRPGLGGLNKVSEPNHPTPYTATLMIKHYKIKLFLINIF